MLLHIFSVDTMFQSWSINAENKIRHYLSFKSSFFLFETDMSYYFIVHCVSANNRPSALGKKNTHLFQHEGQVQFKIFFLNYGFWKIVFVGLPPTIPAYNATV